MTIARKNFIMKYLLTITLCTLWLPLQCAENKAQPVSHSIPIPHSPTHALTILPAAPALQLRTDSLSLSSQPAPLPHSIPMPHPPTHALTIFPATRHYNLIIVLNFLYYTCMICCCATSGLSIGLLLGFLSNSLPPPPGP